MTEKLLSATKRGIAVECTVCRKRKAPIGRSAPPELYLCNPDCSGYYEPPHVGWLWPDESEQDYGLECPDAGTTEAEMGYEEFDKLFEARVEKLREIGRTKGLKYTKHSGDRLGNFKEEAVQLGTTPEKVLHTFFNKHMRAIEDYIKRGDDCGEELVENHITDAIMYLFLLEGLVVERRQATR